MPRRHVDVHQVVHDGQLLHTDHVDGIAVPDGRDTPGGKKPRRVVQRIPLKPVQHVFSGVQRHLQSTSRGLPRARMADWIRFRTLHGAFRHVYGHVVCNDYGPVEGHRRGVRKTGT